METKYSVELTPMDRDIINSYRQMLAGLSDYLGSGYEIVLHSLEDLNHSVISIYHGEHTGRKEGAPITDRGNPSSLRLSQFTERTTVSSVFCA